MAVTETTAQRLKHIRTTLNVTQKKLSEVLKCSQAKVSDYESGKLSISNSDLSVIANTYNINLTWLITGTGPMYNNVPARAKGHPADLVSIPLVADIAAGYGIEAELLPPARHITVALDLLSLPGPYLAFSVCGDSMSPEIYPGDIAVITRAWEQLDTDGRICAFRTLDGLVLKRWIIHPRSKSAALIPLNPRYPIIKYTPDGSDPDLTMLGVLVLVIRSYVKEPL